MHRSGDAVHHHSTNIIILGFSAGLGVPTLPSATLIIIAPAHQLLPNPPLAVTTSELTSHELSSQPTAPSPYTSASLLTDSTNEPASSQLVVAADYRHNPPSPVTNDQVPFITLHDDFIVLLRSPQSYTFTELGGVYIYTLCIYS